jgi:hypothetical protein
VEKRKEVAEEMVEVVEVLLEVVEEVEEEVVVEVEEVVVVEVEEVVEVVVLVGGEVGGGTFVFANSETASFFFCMCAPYL